MNLIKIKTNMNNKLTILIKIMKNKKKSYKNNKNNYNNMNNKLTILIKIMKNKKNLS